MENKLLYLAKTGNIEMVKKFYEKNRLSIDLHTRDELLFKTCCSSNQIKIAKWLIEETTKNYNPINIHIDNNQSFLYCCIFSHIKMAQWLLDYSISIGSEIDFTTYIFDEMCRNGNLNVISWLWHCSCILNKNINIKYKHFEIACINDYVDILDWMDIICKDNKIKIDYRIDNDYLFNIVCERKQCKVAQWFIDNFAIYSGLIINDNILWYSVK